METFTLNNEKKAAIDDMLVRIFTTTVSMRRRELTLNLLNKCNNNHIECSVFEHPLDNVKIQKILNWIRTLHYELGGPIEKYYDRVRSTIF
jgi:hypothetical protein